MVEVQEGGGEVGGDYLVRFGLLGLFDALLNHQGGVWDNLL